MTDAPQHGSRILVGAGSFADAAAALRLVDGLGFVFQAGLGGILVEEADALAAYQIPNQRVILMNGTTILAPSKSQARTLQQADARAFRKSLAQAAKARGANWAFAQEVGDLIPTALKAAAGWDILIIGYRHIHPVRGKIVHIAATGATTPDISDAAKLLAHQFSADRVFFTVHGKIQTREAINDATTVHFKTLDAAMNALARTNAQAVMIDLAQGPVKTVHDLSRLLDASRCPLIVFDASNAFGLLEHTSHMPPALKQIGQKDSSSE